MKNNELHNFLRDLHADDVQTPKFEQGLRRSILNKSRKQSVGRRIVQGFSPRKDPFLRARQRYVSYGSLAMVLVLVLSITVYSYHFSPKAEAEQVIDQSLVTLQAVPTVELDNIQSQLGSDPAAELKEAKSAKDVKVITKDDFVALGKEAKSVIAMSLSSDPSAPKITSVSFNGGPGGAMVAQGKVTAGSGTPTTATGYGYATISAGAPSTDATPANAPTYVTGSAGGTTSVSSDGTVVSSGAISVPASGAAGASGPTTTAVPAPGESGMVTVTGGGIATDTSGPVTATAGTTAMPTSAQLKALPTIKSVTPSTYLKYTNGKGQTVVLSLDAKGLPVYKTIFIGKN